MVPEIDHWFSEDEIPKHGTGFKPSPEGAKILEERINRLRGNLPRIEVTADTLLTVPTDYGAGNGRVRLEAPERLEAVVVDRNEDLFEAAFAPDGTPLSPLEREKVG
jgi:hypothetical protein